MNGDPAGAHAQDQPIAVSVTQRETPVGPVTLHTARIELTDPRIQVIVTRPVILTGNGPEAIATTTPEWAEKEQVTVAVNANVFTAAKPPKPGVKLIGPGDTDIIGLSVSDGFVVSPVRELNGIPDPALVFAKDGTARIGRFTYTDLVGAWNVVAGVGAPIAQPDGPSGLLVTDGHNTGASARVDPTSRHARTAAGISRDGRVLWLVVASGEPSRVDSGLTLPELADVLIEMGAHSALNLDGGASSSFVHRPAIGELVQNAPVRGEFRKVANHLGIRLKPTPPPSPEPTEEPATP